MAGTFSRIRDIFRSKANKALDKMEDPRDTLDLSYEKQLEQLQKVRRGVADVATARKRIELQAQGLQKQADKLQGQAKAALGQGNEDLAREALARRAALGEQLAELKTQHDQISDQEQKLVQTSQELQIRVERFRTQKETMKASYTAAEAQTKVGEAVSGISDSTRSAGRHHAAGPGQDRQHAGAGRRHRRAAGVGRARRPVPPGRRHPEGARQGVVDLAGGQRAGGVEGRARDGRRRRRRRRAAGGRAGGAGRTGGESA